MNETRPVTTTTLLLDGLKDAANQNVWQEFHGRYLPVMLAFARKLGLNPEDAADAAQDALVRFVREYRTGRYDRTRGRLRSWLIGIVKYRVADLKRARCAQPVAAGSSVVDLLPADDELESLWDAEQHRAHLREAFAELRSGSKLADKTIRAFERMVLDEQPAAAVALELDMTLADTYAAKSRVYDRLRAIVTRLKTDYQDG